MVVVVCLRIEVISWYRHIYARHPTFQCVCMRAQGFLLPYYHTSYWIGLVLDLWPSFKWVDPAMPLVTPPYYYNWGNYTGGALQLPLHRPWC